MEIDEGVNKMTTDHTVHRATRRLWIAEQLPVRWMRGLSFVWALAVRCMEV